MAAFSKSGKRFATVSQQRLYDESEGNLYRPSLTRGRSNVQQAPRPNRGDAGATAIRSGQDFASAPSSDPQGAAREHGLAKHVTITREGMGRHRVEAELGDGSMHTSVHPEAYRAVDIAKDLLGIEAPPAFQTSGRARSQPVGPKESDRISFEDGRSGGGIFGAQ